MTSATSTGFAPLEYRPYWQVILVAGLLSLAGYLGSHTSGQPWPLPTLSLLYFAASMVALSLVFRWLNLGLLTNPLIAEPEQSSPAYSATERFIWALLGFLGVVTALLLLEYAYPFYFSQDDNLDSILPVMLHGSGSFFGGIFPEWDPYQFMGSPTAVLGYYGFTYPLTYFSYWFAKHLLGNANAMIDVLASMHLMLGYLAMYWVLRREQCRPSLSMLAASSYALSGYALIFSRSFVQFSSVVLWAPLLVVCLQEMVRRKTGWKWILAFGACIGISFHAGHIQMWAYSILFADLAILLLLLTRAIRFRALLGAVAAHLVGFAIAAPLLIPELLEAHTAVRRPEGTGILSGLQGLFFPDSLAHAPHPIGWGPNSPIGEMYYSGTLFMFVAAVLLLTLLSLRWRLATSRANIWFLCAVFAFVLALGDRGLVWLGLVKLPGFNRFRFPFKFLGFLDLFAIIAATIALERLLRFKNWRVRAEMPLSIAVWTLLFYHCSLATASFCSFSFAPFPSPDPEITRSLLPDGQRYYPKLITAETLSGGEILLMNPDGNRSPDPHYLDSFMNQWPTLSGVFSIQGYDPLVYDSPVVKRFAETFYRHQREAFIEYGVKYFLQYTPPGRPLGSLVFSWPGVHTVYQSATIHLYEIPDARPMAFPEEDPARALRVRFDAGGATIETSELPQGGPVILNMLWRKEFRSTTNRTRLAVEADDWRRIRIFVPSGTPFIRVDYLPPWETGWLTAGALLLSGVVLGWLSTQTREAGA